MPVEKICECCGQTLPRPVLFKVRLSAGDHDIVRFVHKAGRHGIQTERLLELVYSDDPDGGPLCALRSLHVRIVKLNRKIKPEGYRITGQNNGRAYGRYFLNQLEQIDE